LFGRYADREAAVRAKSRQAGCGADVPFSDFAVFVWRVVWLDGDLERQSSYRWALLAFRPTDPMPRKDGEAWTLPSRPS
jgi:hypothetical protein